MQMLLPEGFAALPTLLSIPPATLLAGRSQPILTLSTSPESAADLVPLGIGSELTVCDGPLRPAESGQPPTYAWSLGRRPSSPSYGDLLGKGRQEGAGYDNC